jgi:hypothetical protein
VGLYYRNLTGELVKRNAGHVEVFAGTEQPLDCVADLKGCLTWHTPGSTAAAKHRVDVFHISVKPTAFEVQRGPSLAHGSAALRTGLPAYRFCFFRTWLFIHWSRWGTYVVTMSTDRPALKSTTT